MPGLQPPAVPLSEEERQALHTLIRAHKTPPLNFSQFVAAQQHVNR